MLTPGIPCQPLSKQGRQLRANDVRSLTAAFALGSVSVTLECVPEAFDDPSTQHAIHEYARLCNCDVHQKVLRLSSVWPCRRSRWFATIIPKQYGCPGFADLPVIQPKPVLGDLFPYDPWPSLADMGCVGRSPASLDSEVYRNPIYGSTDRHLKMQEPCPTALHSWGNVLYPCPSACRKPDLSAHMLKQKGLRGIEISSGTWPHRARHMHPKELQLLLGFPPMEAVLDDMRAQVAMFGNSASPILGLWIFSHPLDFWTEISPWIA